MTNLNFENALSFTLDLEGRNKLSMNPKDPGNWTSGKIGKGILKGTKYGVSAAAYPHLDIKNLTYEQAKKIYFANYWTVAKCDLYPWPINAALFDFAVQSGPSRALRYLKSNPDFDAYLKARNKFLNDWADKNPGNRGVRTRVAKLKKLLIGK